MASILCLNLGSSSLKAATFDEQLQRAGRFSSPRTGDLFALLSRTAEELLPEPPRVIAHRVVHGGPESAVARVVDPQLLHELSRLVPMAPLHMPDAIESIKAAMDHFPLATHVACFDTSFHHDLPDIAKRVAIPTHEIRKYGFHGLSCEHVVNTVDETQTRRLVIAHLGAGASVTAVHNGKSVDTSMGFTPCAGIPMATRSGDLDPGILIYLLRNGMSVDEVEIMLNHHSGLKAIAGTGDMQSLLARDDDLAHLAIDIFCERTAQRIAAAAVTLGGMETLVFTGGIGEHCPTIRQAIIDKLEAALGSFEDLVVPADEEIVMARHARSFLPAEHWSLGAS